MVQKLQKAEQIKHKHKKGVKTDLSEWTMGSV